MWLLSKEKTAEAFRRFSAVSPKTEKHLSGRLALLIDLVVIALADPDVFLSELPGTPVGFVRGDLQDILDGSTALGAVNHMRFALYLVCKRGDLSGHRLFSFPIAPGQLSQECA